MLYSRSLTLVYLSVTALVPLTKLRKLWLQYNSIRTVPVEFIKLTQLKELDLTNNPLVHPGIITRTPLLRRSELEQLFAFLAELEHSGEAEQTVLKLMFVGMCVFGLFGGGGGRINGLLMQS